MLFTLQLELLEALLTIKRTLKIPSNISSDHMQEVLMLAMYQFFTRNRLGA